MSSCRATNAKDPRFVLNRYDRFRARLGAPVHVPLSAELDAKSLVARLREFREQLRFELHYADTEAES